MVFNLPRRNKRSATDSVYAAGIERFPSVEPAIHALALVRLATPCKHAFTVAHASARSRQPAFARSSLRTIAAGGLRMRNSLQSNREFYSETR
jgi:hypothetical protein